MPKKPAKKPEPTFTPQHALLRKRYSTLWAAASQAVTMLRQMEEAGALRMPFHGYTETVDNLKDALEPRR